jgi:hypothetical protein
VPWLRLRGAEDPTSAVVILLMLFAGIGIIAWSILGDNDKIRDGGLAALGGALFLLTAYFAARNLQINAATAFNDQLMRAAELLCEPNPVKQVAARETLLRMKRRIRAKADKDSIDAILKQRSHHNRHRRS